MARKRKLTNKQIVGLAKLYKNPKIRMEKLCKIFQVSDDTITRTIKREGITARKTVGFCDEENSNWKGGLSRHYAKNVAVRHFKENKCAICGYKISVDVHHWDNNSRNNKPDNLVLLCPNHHREAHLELLKSHK